MCECPGYDLSGRLALERGGVQQGRFKTGIHAEIESGFGVGLIFHGILVRLLAYYFNRWHPSPRMY